MLVTSTAHDIGIIDTSSSINKIVRERNRGVATGGISVFIPPKSAQVNFSWGKYDVRTAIQQFYTPPQKKKLLYLAKKFLATPLERNEKLHA